MATDKQKKTGWGIALGIVAVVAAVYLIGLAGDWWDMDTADEGDFQTVGLERNMTNQTGVQDGQMTSTDQQDQYEWI